MECLAIEIVDFKLICLCIYRPIGADYLGGRNTNDEFREELMEVVDNCLQKYPDFKILMMGDFNINLLDIKSENARQLVADMAGLGLTNQIHAPTRVCKTTATLIDQCWTNLSLKKTRVLIDGVADHYGTYVEFKHTGGEEEENENERLIRVLNGAAFKRIKKGLRDADWNFLHSDIAIDQKWRTYEETITEVIRKAAPLRRQKMRKKGEEWFTRRLRNLKQKMNLWRIRSDREHNRMCQNGKTTRENYNYHRNKYKKEIKKAKNDFWISQFAQAKDSRQTWTLMNKAMQREQESAGIKELERTDGTTTMDKKEIANIMNNFFANVGEETAKKIPHTDKKPMSYLDDDPSEKIAEKFLYCDQEQVEKIIKQMKPKNNDMANSISMKIIRECREVLSHSLTLLLNESIEKDTFPDILKIAEVVPLYKKGSKKEATNYRPISLLDPFGKIFEKLIEFQLRAFMEYAEHLSPNQHGYREHHSCDSMVISFLQEVSETLRNDDVAVIILLDCSKAFDSISRPLLLEKLRRYGIKDGALDLIRSYLSDRIQRVKVDSTYSDVLPCITGVPQGSILGPLLYIIYTNDVDVAIKSWSALYADDNNSLHRAKSLDEAMTKAQASLQRTEEWFRSNKVCVNGAKSKYIVVARKEQGESDVKLQIEGRALQRVRSTEDGENKSTAYVGLHLDEKFDFIPHIDAMCKRALKNLAILAMIKKRLPKQAKLQIFHSLIQSHLCLNIIASGRANKEQINRLQVIQNKALRIVEDLPARASVAEARKKHKILTIKSQYEFTNCMWAAKTISGNAPKNVKDIVEQCKNFERNTQLVIDNIQNERARKLSAKNSIAKAWNDLDQDVRRDLVKVMRRERSAENLNNDADRLRYTRNTLKKIFLERDQEAENQRKK